MPSDLVMKHDHDMNACPSEMIDEYSTGNWHYTDVTHIEPLLVQPPHAPWRQFLVATALGLRKALQLFGGLPGWSSMGGCCGPAWVVDITRGDLQFQMQKKQRDFHQRGLLGRHWHLGRSQGIFDNLAQG